MKNVFTSKTMWVNLIALIASVTAGLGFDLGLDVATQGTLVMGIMAVVNIVLRATTSKAVTLT